MQTTYRAVESLMRQGETLHATEGLLHATGWHAPTRRLSFLVLWQTCGLCVGESCTKAAAKHRLLLVNPSAENIMKQDDPNCLVTDNTLHVHLADYAMISTMSGR
jgi:hypothetical protein